MKPKYELKPKMTFIGFSITIPANEGYSKCPEFWDKEYNQKYSHLFKNKKPNTPIEKAILENHIGSIAICDDKDGYFEYWIAGIYEGGEVPSGLKLISIPECKWAIFSSLGALPKSLQNLNTRIWNEWYPTEGKKYMTSSSVTIEEYPEGNMNGHDYESFIWVKL